jgi:hypothetical protein
MHARLLPAEDPATVRDALLSLICHPRARLLGRWNWKAALTSSIVRGTLFFCVNLAHGWDAAQAAFLTELVLRAATSGFYGTVTQTFRSVEPRRAATVAALVLLPVLSHSVEWVVHLFRGTEALGLSIGASVVLTGVSTAFNLHVMRHGVLTVGAGSQSLAADFKKLPDLVLSFLGARSRPLTPRHILDT